MLVLVPLFVVTYRTIADGWAAFWDAVSSADAVAAFRLTAEIAVAAVAINIVFGVRVALLVTRYRFWGRRLLGPLDGWFGKGLAAHGFQVIYALPGMITATAFVSMPLVLREIVPVLEEEGIDQEQAAKVLGASAVQRFLRITLPTIRPALAYGIVLSLARSIGEFGAVKVVSATSAGSAGPRRRPW